MTPKTIPVIATTMAIIVLLLVAAQAALYVFYEGELIAAIIPPPVVLDTYPGQSQVNGTTGPNKTSIAINIKAVKDWNLLTYNSYFDYGGEGWYYYYNYTIYYGSLDSSLFTATILDTYNGATNVALLYGDLNVTAQLIYSGIINIYRATASHIQLLLQEVTIPDPLPEQMVLNVTHMEQYSIRGGATLSSGCNLVVGLYDTENNTFAWSNTSVACTTSWNTTSYQVNLTTLEPGKTYILVAGIYVYGDTIALSQYTMEVLGEGFFDSIELYYLPPYPQYNGPAIGVNVTSGSYWAKLVLKDLSADNGTNATLLLVNVTGNYEGNISVVNGQPVSNETGYVEIAPPPPNYYAARVTVHASIPQGTSINFTLTLVYWVGGVTVEYPVNITIVDPPRPLSPSNPQASITSLGTTIIADSRSLGGIIAKIGERMTPQLRQLMAKIYQPAEISAGNIYQVLRELNTTTSPTTS